MWKRAVRKCRKLDLSFLTNVIFWGFGMCVFVVTLWIFMEAPAHVRFAELGSNDVWFGAGWTYTADGLPAVERSGRYLRLGTEDNRAEITKIMDFTPGEGEYLCFRVKAQDVTVYVNGEIFYQKSITEYREHAKQMYVFHQMPAEGIAAGDRITIALGSDEASYFNLQFLAIGDRYALTRYILEKSAGSLLACVAAFIIIIVCLVTSHSPVLTERRHDARALNRLAVFLALSVVYLSMDSGCMELFVNKAALVSWITGFSLLLLPMPFILFTESAFFPGQKWYELLAFANLVICIVGMVGYIVFAASMVTFFVYVHGLIFLDIIVCVISFIEERTSPSAEVVIGFAAVIVTAVVSIVTYWKGLLAPASTPFGYGLLVFSGCMLVWIVRRRYELNSMRNEADHIFAEREKRAAEEASEQKSRFLSHMSHEIRTPLNAMLGMNELIMHETDNPTIKKYTDNIQNAGRTLLALINDVLDFSKIETGKIDIVESDYSLSSVLNDVVVMVQGRAADKGLELRLDVDGTLPDMLRGDEIRVKQIILNLMTNAAKYTNAGWIELGVHMKTQSECLDDENIILVVRVSDTGIGIKEEERSKLFKEFERLDRRRNQNIEGTGLGLSITARLIEFMDGKISVESVYGKGSTFTIEIPQRIVSRTAIGDYRKRFETLSDEHGQQRGEQEQSLEDMSFPGKRVLVVDDNEMNLEVIASILELLDIRVERAGGGQEAIDRLGRERFDLVLTDDMMPEIDGKQVLKYIRTHEECPNFETPVVVLTANAVSGARDEYAKLGFDAYMTKPIDVDVLQKILIKYLK